MTCDPLVYGGNFVQTLFLGATVVNYSATLGWNSTPSEVTVVLAEDTCSSATGKLYYDSNMNSQIHYGSDYFNPPPLGYPVRFVFGSFVFTGILQNWKYVTDVGGKKITVKIVSPTEVLAGTSIILGGYNGPTYGIPNLINIYSFLEWYYGIPVPIDYQEQTMLGYTPVTSFGGSYKNEAGIPWPLIRQALNIIINSGFGGNFGNRLMLRDVSYYFDISELPYLNNTFRIGGDNKDLLSLVTEICDLAGRDFFLELVVTPGFSSGVRLNPLQQLAGILSPSLMAFIKIRTVSRSDQAIPARNVDRSIGVPLEDRLRLGAINSYVSNLTTVNLDRGIELRSETTNAILVGGERDDIHQVQFAKTGINWGYSTYDDTITHYWGLDDDGYPVISKGYNHQHRTWFCINNKFTPYIEQIIQYWINWGISIDSSLQNPWFVLQAAAGDTVSYSQLIEDVDDAMLAEFGMDTATYDAINDVFPWCADTTVWNSVSQSITKNYPFTRNEFFSDGSYRIYYPIDAPEIIAALSDKSTWEDYIANYGPLWKRYMLEALEVDWVTGNLQGLYLLMSKYPNSYLSAENRKNTSLIAALRAGVINTEQDTPHKNGAEALYNYVHKLATEFYGRKFLVSINTIKAVPDGNGPFGSRANYSVTQDGWSDASYIIGLPNNQSLSLFKNPDNGKLYGFAYFDASMVSNTSDSYLDLSEVSPSDYIAISPRSAYIKVQVEDIVFMDPVNKYDGRVVISLPAPLFTSHVITSDVSGIPYLEKRDWKEGFQDDVMGRRRPGNDTLKFPGQPIPAFPLFAAIPLHSHELSYGPWSANAGGGIIIADANKTEYIKDPDFVPWNYGSTWNMNYAAQLSVNTKVVRQNVVEFGNFTLPGLPMFSMGQVAINNGPELTEFSITMGDGGMTTTYGMKTFTPNYGSIGKSRIDNIKRMGVSQLKTNTLIQKSLAERKTWQSSGGNVFTKLLSRGDRYSRTSSVAFLLADAQPDMLPAGTMVSATEIELDGGGTMTIDQYYQNGYQLVDLGQTKNSVTITDFRKCMPEIMGYSDADYQKRAGVCTEGLFRPYSTDSNDYWFPTMIYGDNFVTTPPVATQLDYTFYDYSNNISMWGNPPVSGAGTPPINSWSMNPFLEGYDNDSVWQDFEQYEFAIAYKGHDIEYVIRDGTYPVDLSVRSPYDNYSTDFNYRSVGLKTPLILVGWGYDIDGYPVPNAGNGAARQSVFEDEFLRNTTDWKVGPLDVRWDENRGVWTCPSPMPVIRCKALNDSSLVGSTFGASIEETLVVSDSDGNIITNKIILVHNEIGSLVNKDDIVYVTYNPNSYYSSPNFHKYELIGGGSSPGLPGDAAVYTVLMIGVRTSLGGSGVITHSTQAGDSLVGSGCILISGPDISGYSYLGFRSYPNPNCPEIRLTPYSTPAPIVNGYMTASAQAKLLDRDYRTVINSLDIPVTTPNINVNFQWNGTDWVSISSECFNAPVLEVT